LESDEVDEGEMDEEIEGVLLPLAGSLIEMGAVQAGLTSLFRVVVVVLRLRICFFLMLRRHWAPLKFRVFRRTCLNWSRRFLLAWLLASELSLDELSSSSFSLLSAFLMRSCAITRLPVEFRREEKNLF
jgi:hypothetical protein